MADNYMMFSLGVQLNSPEEAEWVETVLDEDKSTDLLSKITEVEEFECLGFEWQIDGQLELWIHDGDGQGNTTHVANFLGEYLRKFEHKLPIAFEFCWSCSKPRIGEFGGGACVVSATEEKWFNSAQFIQDNT